MSKTRPIHPPKNLDPNRSRRAAASLTPRPSRGTIPADKRDRRRVDPDCDARFLRTRSAPKRPSELKRLVHGITQKMLIQTLRELEADGLVSRKMFNQVPPKVEYSTTDLCQTLEPTLKALCQWGDSYADKTFAKGEVQILNDN